MVPADSAEDSAERTLIPAALEFDRWAAGFSASWRPCGCHDNVAAVRLNAGWYESRPYRGARSCAAAASTPGGRAARGLRKRTRRWTDDVCAPPGALGGDHYEARSPSDLRAR